MKEQSSDKKKYYPLTHAQKRIYYDDKLHPGVAVGTQAFIVRYPEILDRGLLESAINKVIQKNDAFRLRIIEIDYKPMQYVSPFSEHAIDYIEFSGPNSEIQMREWVGRTTQECIEVIDNTLYYFAIIKFNEKESGYYLKFHHVASDGGSYPIVFSEINQIYRTLVAGKLVDERTFPSYLDYIADELDYLGSPQVAKDKEFWHKTLIPLPKNLNLSPKKGDPSDLKGSVYTVIFPEDVRVKMDDYCKTNRTSLFKLIFAAISIYSARISGLEDVCITAVNHNRFHVDPLKRANREKTIGMYVSTLPFRVPVSSDFTFEQLVTDVGNNVINEVLKKYQLYPFDRLLAELRDTTGEDAGYLMDILISSHGDVSKEEYTFEHIFQGYVPGSINIHINYNNKYLDGLLELEYEYRISHYEQSDIERFHLALVNLLCDALSNPVKKIAEIEFLSSKEKSEILYEFNREAGEINTTNLIHQLFEAQVEKTPGAIAVADSSETLTYAELNQKSNQLAHHLRKKGVGAQTLVFLIVERSVEMYIGLMAILKSGGVFIPYGTENIEAFNLAQKRIKCEYLIIGKTLTQDTGFQREIVNLGDSMLFRGETSNLEPITSPTDWACIYDDTDSYGRNKNIVFTHVAIVNSLKPGHNIYIFKDTDIYLAKTPFHLCSSIPELFTWFIGGGSVFALAPKEEKNTQKIVNTIHERKITHAILAPTIFNRLVNYLRNENIEKIVSLKYLFLFGEVVIPETIARFKQLSTHIIVENLYGSPETSIFNSSFLVSKWNGHGVIPIGKPLNHTKIYILDFINGAPVVLPVGVPGELCVAGIGLATGYWENSELTNTKFIDNPFDKTEPYKKLFRSGELARWLPDGNLEYLGRIDHSVKIRGTRIEREEIENYLLKQPEIQEAAVVARQDESGIYLCAYIVSNEEVDTAAIRERLSLSLPVHMIPSYLLQIDEIPVNSDGTADRAELMDIKHDPHQIETILAEIEAEILHLNRNEINIDESLFKLGVHSHNVAKMAAKIRKAFNVKLSMGELFKRPTLRQLSEYLTEAIKIKYSSIEPAIYKEYYPQSSAQKRLYFLHQLEEEDTVYNIQMMDIYCKGFEKDKLEDAFKQLLKRHESLRTSFHIINGEPVQKIHDYEEVGPTFKIEYYETDEAGKIHTWEPGVQSSEQKVGGQDFQEVIKRFVRPFDLSKPTLLRVGFIQIHKYTKILMLDMHHIIADGISMRILAQELWELYDGNPLPPLRIQYKDFSEWLSNENQVKTVKEQEMFWLKEFSGEIPMINLPTDFPRPSKLSFDGNIFQFDIEKNYAEQLRKIALQHAESLYMVLFAAYNVLLNKISGQEDVVVGTVSAGRGHEDLENIVGMFLNTLPLRNYPEGKKLFSDFLSEIKINTFAAFENQDYPFDELVSKVALREDPSRNPLFDVAFGLENESDPTGYLMEVAIPDKTKPYDFGTNKSKFDMTLVCVETEGGVDCTIEYKTALFRQDTISRIAAYFKKIVYSICTDIFQKIGEISIISELEKETIIYEFNNTKADYPTDKTIHEFFEEKVEQYPENIALSYKGKRLTYREVNHRANQLARVLRAKGVQPDNMVGIMVERCMEMIIGIIAIEKAGGAYLPLDPNYPEDRIRYIFKDSNSKLLLTLERFITFAKSVEFGGEVMNLESQSLYQGDTQNLENVTDPKNLAYIIYTSGSTGKPKGVMIEHVAAVNILLTLDKFYPIEATDAYLLKTAFLFDVSVSEIFGWFWRGGKLAILEQGEEKDPLMIIERIYEEKITHLNFVPSMFNVFVSMLDQQNIKKLDSLRYIFLAGEAIWPDSVLKFRQFGTNVLIENLYGPTEATVYASWYPVSKWEGAGSVSIGKAIDNLKLYILSSDNKARPALQPVGIAGELVISGIQLARGYLNRPELTAQMFVSNPFAEYEGNTENFKRLYHTGDLTRWAPDGNVQYMGRIDFQVKVRGYRIELGEIESQLNALEEIKESIVIVRQDKEGEKYLCAYLIADEEIDVSSVRKRLSQNIPSYMVPSYFVQIDHIPLNPNGKLDRKALPEPEAEVVTTKYAEPTNEMEEILAVAWAEALGAKRVGIDDNFFEIGGDSIKTIMISAKLKKLQLNVSINDFFTYKTIRKLAKHVKKIERKIDQGPVTGQVELTPIHKWFFEKDTIGLHYFNQVVMQKRKGGFDPEIVNSVFRKIVEHHDALRMVYKTEGDRIIQQNRGINEGDLIHLEVIAFDNKEHYEKESEEIMYRINDSIKLETGPLVKLGLFKIPDHDDILMIGIHHNVMDGISWRILLEDFDTGYRQLEKGEEIVFPKKSDSFKEWAMRLKEYANSTKALEELDYWKGIEETQVQQLPMGMKGDKKDRKYKNQKTLFLNLEMKKTQQLIKDANWVYNTEINDLFLTVLGLSVKEWSGHAIVLTNLEGHGREAIMEGIDISRTIGWFTSQYPVLLNMSSPEALEDKNDELAFQIRNVKETLRQIPNKGVGYGILKYLTSPAKRENMSFKLQPEICFNYLGQLVEEGDTPGEKLLLNIVLKASGDCDTSYPIDIYGGVGSDGLNLLFNYDSSEFCRSDIETLIKIFKDKLIEVTDHCINLKDRILKQKMSAVEYHIAKDYKLYKDTINREMWPELNQKKENHYILLTGGTGFLGGHIVAELMSNTNATLYLPIRGSNQANAEERFRNKINFYFGEDFYKTYKHRFNVMQANLSENHIGVNEAQYDELVRNVDSVIHPAANVKHYGEYEALYRDNVLPVEHLLELAQATKKADMHYVSTISVGDADVPGREYILFTEFCENVGNLDHIYLKSKYEGEKRVRAYRNKGVNGSIYRVGNLIFHSETGKFQENIGDDYFYNIIRGAIKLEMLSERMKEKMIFDMSFINYTARSIVLLATSNGLKNQTYHLLNPSPLPMTEMAQYLREMGYHFNDVADEGEYLKKFDGNSEYEKIIELLRLHSWVFEDKKGTEPVYKIDRTMGLLKKLGLEWPKTSKELVEKMIAYCKKVGFL